MAKLAASTIVQSPPGSALAFQVFGPSDDEVPEWAARQMGTHMFDGGEHPFPEEPPPGRDPGTPPPKAGAGSGIDAWLLYAAEQNVDVPDGAKRDEIVQILVDAGVPVDRV